MFTHVLWSLKKENNKVILRDKESQGEVICFQYYFQMVNEFLFSGFYFLLTRCITSLFDHIFCIVIIYDNTFTLLDDLVFKFFLKISVNFFIGTFSKFVCY